MTNDLGTGLAIRVSNPGTGNRYFSSKRSYHLWGLPKTPIQVVPESLGLKRPGREADH